MRLIDADALREQALSYDYMTDGGVAYCVDAVPLSELDAAPTVCCGECRHGPEDWDKDVCDKCWHYGNFERRTP